MFNKPAEASSNNNKAESKSIAEYYWYKLELEKEKGIERKLFKSKGQLNGDVLEYQYNCCALFNSKSSGLLIHFCKDYIKIQSKYQNA